MKIPNLIEIKKELFKRNIIESELNKGYINISNELFKNYNNYIYFLFTGGRASGKTQGIARFLLYLAMQKENNLRIFCGREIQRTIEDSVYKVFIDIIHNLQLPFEITKTYIKSINNYSEFRFAGFREQGRYNLQGLEGIDILWVDEAQAISKNTLDIVLPTIRKKNSKIIFSMNRFLDDDAVYKQFQNYPDTFIHHSIYLQNKYNNDIILNQANFMKENSYDDYMHIWLGEPQKNTTNTIINLDSLKQAINRNINDDGEFILGVDVARYGDDRTVIYKRKGLKLIDDKVLKGIDLGQIGLVYTANEIENFSNYNKNCIINIDETGIGGGLIDILRSRGYNKVCGINNNGTVSYENRDKYANKITEMFYNLKNIINDISIYEDIELFRELSTRRYKYDNKGRIIIESKDDFKKRYGKSPDKGDAFILCFNNNLNVSTYVGSVFSIGG